MDTSATRQHTTERDVVLSVTDAAVVFGISPGAVRKRIERGQLPGRKIAGQWRVVLNATDATRRDNTQYDNTTRPNTTDATRPAPQDGPRAQLDAVMSEWLLPLMKQIAEQAEQIGEQRIRIEQLQGERDTALMEATTLRSRLEATDLPTEESVANKANAVPERPQRDQRRSWWHRLLYGDHDPAGMPGVRA